MHPIILPIIAAGNDRQSGANSEDGGYDYLTDKGVAQKQHCGCSYL